MQEHSQSTPPSDHSLIVALAQQGMDAAAIVARTGANIHTVRVLMRRPGVLAPKARAGQGEVG